MLDRTTKTWPPIEADSMPGIELGDTMRAAFAGLRRQWVLVAGCTLLSVLAGIAYVLNTSPQYTATAAIIVDLRGGGGASEEVVAPFALLADAFVASEVAVLRSRELTGRVVKRLGLLERAAAEPPEAPGHFGATVAALKEGMKSLLGAPAPPPAADAETDALQTLERVRRNLTRALDITHNGDTFVIDIAFTAGDPVFAASVVNTLIEEYFLIEAEETYDNTRRVNEWLTTRVQLLTDAVAEADAAVDAYRSQNDLFAMRGGVLPANAEYVAANEQLIATRNQIVDVGAEIDRLRKEIDDGSIDIRGEGGSTTLGELQRQYVQAIERERDFAARLGNTHAKTREAREDIVRTRQLIVEEQEKFIERLVSRRETLELQAGTTAERIEALSAAAAVAAQKSIRLRELEREAESKRHLFEAMLERLNETTHEQTFEAAPARIIAKAVPPDTKSAPRTNILLTLSLFGGLVCGSALAFTREVLDNTVRRADRVEEEFGVPLLGLAPLIGADLARVRHKVPRAKGWRRRSGRELSRQGARMRFAADNEGSMFAETLRALDVRLTELARTGDSIALGFTSARKGEGKSTLAGNFATVQAARGYAVVLIDFDVRASAFTKALKRLPRENTLERLLVDPAAAGAIKPSADLCGLHVLCPRSHLIWSDANTLRQLKAVIAALKERFDYIIVDVPPMTGLVDARIAAGIVDHMVLAIEWGRTRTVQLQRALLGNAEVRARLVGATFTKVRPRAYARYNGDDFADYYAY